MHFICFLTKINRYNSNSYDMHFSDKCNNYGLSYTPFILHFILYIYIHRILLYIL